MTMKIYNTDEPVWAKVGPVISHVTGSRRKTMEDDRTGIIVCWSRAIVIAEEEADRQRIVTLALPNGHTIRASFTSQEAEELHIRRQFEHPDLEGFGGQNGEDWEIEKRKRRFDAAWNNIMDMDRFRGQAEQEGAT